MRFRLLAVAFWAVGMLGYVLPSEAMTTCAIPNTFANGVIADANQLNSNYAALNNCLPASNKRLQPTITSGGTANAQTLTYSPAVSAHSSGDVYTFIAGATN